MEQHDVSLLCEESHILSAACLLMFACPFACEGVMVCWVGGEEGMAALHM